MMQTFKNFIKALEGSLIIRIGVIVAVFSPDEPKQWIDFLMKWGRKHPSEMIIIALLLLIILIVTKDKGSNAVDKSESQSDKTTTP
ncbi:hypothetical protein BAMA_15645 [Bacillus manliponensis]|uniref:Uncharacterized protein n=1 Tax=Bacillus manliponensis TaxID=574376 RepID=A0A073JSU5_9BACI|nr:hypothetical protein [Bacillus manliponensis]KEK17322.1 hypothetical protein BAMA_15645 [Bacillus manliponensis]